MSLRAAIYSRYSSDLQSDSSIEDQVTVCRRYAERAGWQVARVFEDRAMSGASAARPGFQALRAAVDAGGIDVVIVESLDRIGRKLADTAAFADQLNFRNVKLWTTSQGQLHELHVGIFGAVAQQFLADLKAKTKRGMLGRVLAGKVAGGKAYGYDIVESDDGGRGARRINEREAAVVRRIFAMFAAGQSPRAIAHQLNAEGIAGPNGRTWIDTTIRGQPERGTGLLNNELYLGKLAWNRCGYVKDPRTGKRVARPNPRKHWEIVEVPDLRIVSDDEWARAKARQSSLSFTVARDGEGHALNRTHRRKFLLSGKLVCGTCGGGYTMVNRERYGCAAHRQKGTCGNAMTISRTEIESRVITGLRERLMAPEAFREFVEEFQAEVARAAQEALAARVTAERDLGRVNAAIAAIIRAIEDGQPFRTLSERLRKLEDEQSRLRQVIAEAPAAAPVRLHPKLPEVYAGHVATLERLLADDSSMAEAMEEIRALVDRIVLTPGQEGLAAALHGDLASILALSEAAARKADPKSISPRRGSSDGARFSVVAGAGFEPTTFRL